MFALFQRKKGILMAAKKKSRGSAFSTTASVAKRTRKRKELDDPRRMFSEPSLKAVWDENFSHICPFKDFLQAIKDGPPRKRNPGFVINRPPLNDTELRACARWLLHQDTAQLAEDLKLSWTSALSRLALYWGEVALPLIRQAG